MEAYVATNSALRRWKTVSLTSSHHRMDSPSPLTSALTRNMHSEPLLAVMLEKLIPNQFFSVNIFSCVGNFLIAFVIHSHI